MDHRIRGELAASCWGSHTRRGDGMRRVQSVGGERSALLKQTFGGSHMVKQRQSELRPDDHRRAAPASPGRSR